MAKQPSGLSPTHEEYREAKDKRPVLAFVQDGVNRDLDQASFVNEVQAWDSGLFREGFSSPDQLRAKITLRLHEWEVATMAGPVDEQEMLQRALSLIPEERSSYPDPQTASSRWDRARFDRSGTQGLGASPMRPEDPGNVSD
jgi:hypothetical protein